MPIRYTRKVSAALRKQIAERDKWTCQICGVDLEALKRDAFPCISTPRRVMGAGFRSADRHLMFGRLEYELEYARAVLDDMMTYIYDLEQAQAAHAQYPWLRKLTYNDSVGDIDHIMPICEGGDNSPSNLRLLCRGCHKIASVNLRARLAKRPVKRKTGVRL